MTKKYLILGIFVLVLGSRITARATNWAKIEPSTAPWVQIDKKTVRYDSIRPRPVRVFINFSWERKVEWDLPASNRTDFVDFDNDKDYDAFIKSGSNFLAFENTGDIYNPIWIENPNWRPPYWWGCLACDNYF